VHIAERRIEQKVTIQTRAVVEASFIIKLLIVMSLCWSLNLIVT